MLVVDSTVWIDYFNGQINPQTDYLDANLGVQPILVGDIILGEVLQGFRHDRDFEQAHQALTRFPQTTMVNPALALQSARNYRALRKQGLTVRKAIDCFIATFCIENSHQLLHNDHDFDPFEQHLGLSVVHPE